MSNDVLGTKLSKCFKSLKIHYYPHPDCVRYVRISLQLCYDEGLLYSVHIKVVLTFYFPL
jgi:hypothetical protein